MAMENFHGALVTREEMVISYRVRNSISSRVTKYDDFTSFFKIDLTDFRVFLNFVASLLIKNRENDVENLFSILLLI